PVQQGGGVVHVQDGNRAPPCLRHEDRQGRPLQEVRGRPPEVHLPQVSGQQEQRDTDLVKEYMFSICLIYSHH
ncbi:MAG: hypothetical protein ACK55Z_35135, partial [bacterium]